MSSPPGGTPLEPSFVSRVAAGVRYAFTGRAPEGWFGPGERVPVVAPPQEPKGRAWDYPFAANVSYRPRSEAGETAITFETLRRMAEPTLGGFDLLRLAIETRKDQMAAQRWSIAGRDGSDGGDRARKLEQVLRRPDRVNTFRQWQRAILEDLFVLDAPTLYLRDTTEGFRRPEVVDGATIKRILTEDGRTPLPPEAAFQQVVKGVPAFDYTLDELIYAPRNVRPHRIYGFSPVEQVILTIQIALNRQVSQLYHYSAGNIPRALISVPENWTPQQIADFQKWFDAYLAGNLEAKSGAIFIPGGSKPTITSDSPVKDEFDEWLARIVCYAFSISPQSLIRQMNRATADTAKESAAEEGLEPLKLWFADLVDDVLDRGFDAPDLAFKWNEEEITDPEVKAKVTQILAGGKPVITIDEAREEYGKAPLTPEQRDELAPPPPPMLLPPGGPKDEPAGKGPDDGEGEGKEPPAKAEPPDAEKIAKAVADELARSRLFVAKTMRRGGGGPPQAHRP